MKNKFPIRYKFLVVTTVLIVFSVVSYLFLASHIFRRDKIELVFDLNRSAVTSLGSEVGTLFGGIADKMRLVAILSQDSSPQSKALVNDVLDADSSIVFAVASYGFQNFDRVYFLDREFAETYGLASDFYAETLLQARPVPYAEIQTAGEAIWNATVQDGPPLIGFGKSVVPEIEGTHRGAEAAPFAMIVFVRADKLLQAFGGSRLNEVVAVNRKGEPLIHSQADILWRNSSLAANPLFMFATERKMKTGVLRYSDSEREMLGAFSSGYGGRIYVLSQIDSNHAFAAVERLVVRSLIFASIALTLAFLAAVFFSRSLTRPIQALAETMARVSKGELDTKADVQTRDEIAILANSFNSMISDLRASRYQLEEINRDLENKVKDRTRRLEEQNLAVKKAQEALLQTTRLATVGEVAGRAAHEVLNPLTSIVTRLEKVRSRMQQSAVQEIALIKGIVQSWEQDHSQGGFAKLLEGWESPSSVDPSISLWQEDLENFKRVEETMGSELAAVLADVEFVLKESQRINKIVQNMRTLTRPREGVRVHSVSDVARDAIKIMMDFADHHKIEVREDFAQDEDSSVIDRDEMIQCFTNLIRNSIQAIEERRRRGWSDPAYIRLSTQVVNGLVEIEIEDNGAGIDPEHKTKLFEIQFTTKQAEEGTGLGLTITRRFIRDFGGDISLKRSVPGEGTVFLIQLPLRTTSEMEDDSHLDEKDKRRVAS